MNLPHWLIKKRGKEIPESDCFTLPLTRQEMTALVQTGVAVCRLEQRDMADKEVLGTIFNRIVRWAERQGADNEPSVVFIGLRLTQQELTALTKNLVNIRRSDQLENANKEILGGVLDRVVRWAERQGAWWDDGHKIINSVGQQID